jgi:hypothetical protein
MTLRQTLVASSVATIALLVPVAAQADRYYDVEVYRAPTVVYEPAPPADATVTRYWDSARGAWVERRVIEEHAGWHWVPSHRVIEADGREYFVDGHWER